MTKMSVEFRGVPALLEKLTPQWLYWKIVKQALDELGAQGAQEARREAGSFRRTGAMAAAMTHRVNSVPKPLWVVVTMHKLPRRYPFMLEFGAKFGHKDWLLKSVRRAQAASSKFASAAASKIEAKWRS